MSVKVHICYNEFDSFNLEISENELERFAEHISSHKIYWDKDVIKGFWTDISKVRYIEFLRDTPGVCNEQREPVSENSAEISPEA